MERMRDFIDNNGNLTVPNFIDAVLAGEEILNELHELSGSAKQDKRTRDPASFLKDVVKMTQGKEEVKSPGRGLLDKLQQRGRSTSQPTPAGAVSAAPVDVTVDVSSAARATDKEAPDWLSAAASDVGLGRAAQRKILDANVSRLEAKDEADRRAADAQTERRADAPSAEGAHRRRHKSTHRSTSGEELAQAVATQSAIFSFRGPGTE